MTPVLLQQFRLFYDTDAGPPSAERQAHRCRAVGASCRRRARKSVSEEVEGMLAQGTTFSWPASGGTLRPQDWKSGERPSSSNEAVGQGKVWVVEVIAPFGGAEEMVKDLKANVHPGREMKFLALGRDGTKEVRVA